MATNGFTPSIEPLTNLLANPQSHHNNNNNNNDNNDKNNDTWLFHKDFDNDLLDVPGLSPQVREEILNTAWEYSRSIIPQYTNWTRFCCWVRCMVIGIFVEYKGESIDILESNMVYGYNVDEILDTMLRDRPGAEDMKVEYRAFLLMTAEKSSHRCVCVCVSIFTPFIPFFLVVCSLEILGV